MTAPRPTLRTLPAIVGPTAAGKSALALALAETVGGAILSADSRQLYRGFDVGTAKPTPTDRARLPHLGVDVAPPTERWTAGRWANACEAWVEACDAGGRAPILVGGTGLYLRALAEPLFAEPPLDPARRDALGQVLAGYTTAELRRWVAALDPARAALQRTQLVRATEVALLTGERISALHARDARPARFAIRYLVVDPGPVLATRIADRVDRMLAGGWLDEVRALAASVPADAPAWQSTGYDVWRRHLAGDLGVDEARTRVVVATRQYAKRQRTWFRHQLGASSVTHVDPDRPDALDRVLAWWRAGTSPALPESFAVPRGAAPQTILHEDAA